MTDFIVKADDISISINDKQIIEGLSFGVARGTCTALVGETGSGKSMTCRLLSGLLGTVNARVTSGTASFDGNDLLNQSAASWRRLRGRRIALIPQSSMSSLDPVRRIGSQLRETLAVLDPGCDTRARAMELLDQVRLIRPAEVLRSYPHQLSGGMRQRVMIALALAGNPELLIADEATTALDVTVQRGIMKLIAELRAERKMTLILVTHDLALARSASDNMVVMYRGRSVEQGPVDEVFERPAHEYTRALLAATPAAAKRGELFREQAGAK